MAVTANPAALPRDGAEAMRPRLFRVARLQRETDEVLTVALEPAGRAERCGFSPGQFNMLYAVGVGEVPISISGSPRAEERFLHTIRGVGAVTQALCRSRRGDVVGLRGPFGTSWPVPATRADAPHDVVVVAGGIGLAPLRPVIYEILAHRDRYRRFVILYGARSPAELLYRKELERWRGRFDVEVEVTVDRASPEWRGHVGVVTNLIPRVTFEPSTTVAMICGPEVMLRFTASTLRQCGVPASSLFVSLERHMQCGIGLCGHCQYGPSFLCKDGPVMRYDQVRERLDRREL